MAQDPIAEPTIVDEVLNNAKWLTTEPISYPYETKYEIDGLTNAVTRQRMHPLGNVLPTTSGGYLEFEWVLNGVYPDFKTMKARLTVDLSVTQWENSQIAATAGLEGAFMTGAEAVELLPTLFNFAELYWNDTLVERVDPTHFLMLHTMLKDMDPEWLKTEGPSAGFFFNPDFVGYLNDRTTGLLINPLGGNAALTEETYDEHPFTTFKYSLDLNHRDGFSVTDEQLTATAAPAAAPCCTLLNTLGTYANASASTAYSPLRIVLEIPLWTIFNAMVPVKDTYLNLHKIMVRLRKAPAGAYLKLSRTADTTIGTVSGSTAAGLTYFINDDSVKFVQNECFLEARFRDFNPLPDQLLGKLKTQPFEIPYVYRKYNRAVCAASATQIVSYTAVRAPLALFTYLTSYPDSSVGSNAITTSGVVIANAPVNMRRFWTFDQGSRTVATGAPSAYIYLLSKRVEMDGVAVIPGQESLEPQVGAVGADDAVTPIRTSNYLNQRDYYDACGAPFENGRSMVNYPRHFQKDFPCFAATNFNRALQTAQGVRFSLDATAYRLEVTYNCSGELTTSQFMHHVLEVAVVLKLQERTCTVHINPVG
jgi:hypothetical protein